MTTNQRLHSVTQVEQELNCCTLLADSKMTSKPITTRWHRGVLIMPIHNWNRVPAGLFHDFHQSWCIRIKDALNRGCLPRGISALVEQRAGNVEPDVLAIESPWGRSRPPTFGDSNGAGGGVATLTPPSTRIMRRTSSQRFADKANRIVIKHHLGRILAVIEIMSPGNKDRQSSLESFVEKTVSLLDAGINVLVVDLFAPTSRDPLGIHKLIWDQFKEEEFTFPDGKDRTLASYANIGEWAAFVEPIAVGDTLPDMPVYLTQSFHVMVPLEPTYQATWEASPEEMREAVETGVMPNPDAEE